MNRLTRYNPKLKHYVRLASRLAVDNEMGKLEDLAESLGCPLDVRIKVTHDTIIVDKVGHLYTEIEIFKDYFLAYDGRVARNGFLEPTTFYWKDYGNKWWLKEVLEND